MALKRSVLIAGPTATGKSDLALRLARRLNAVVVNADALQVYACWRVLTARPCSQDLARADHALYGHVAYDASYSVGHWLREVQALRADERRMIIVGGTGLYLTALTTGLAEIPPTPDEIRVRGNAILAAEGIDFFQEYVSATDPLLFARMDRKNPMRLQRAWEVHQTTGRSMSDWHAETPPPILPLADTIAVNLVSNRDWLNTRISVRFDRMVASGALDEVRQIRDRWDPSLPASKALGAAELIAYLDGKVDLESSVTKAKTATRQFAKRQRSWFRSNMDTWRNVAWPVPDLDAFVDQLASGT